MANTFLSRSNSSGTSTQKGTISVWIKGSEEPSGNNQTTLACWGNANNHGALIWNGGDKIDAFDYQSGYASQLQTNALLRDSSAWYHIVYAWDTTLSTANDRQKIYINGIEQTYSTRTNYSTNAATSWNANSYSMRVGGLNSSSYFNGLMSHIHFIDGTAYAPTVFGSTDSTTGQWKINTSPSVTYGNNGFFILKDGNTITDSSPNSNNFSLSGGTLTKTEDCPSNNFCTFNPLNKSQSNLNLTNGNTTLASAASGWFGSCGTLGFQKGFATYFEAKAKTIVYALTWGLSRIGEGTNGTPLVNPVENDSNYDYITRPTSANTVYYKGANQNVTVSAIAAGDILSCLISASGVVKFYINDSLTHTYSQVLLDNSFYFPVAGANGSSQGWDFNFGNGYFGTTAVASAGINASGNGIFEYDIPSGTTALSTKGLNL